MWIWKAEGVVLISGWSSNKAIENETVHFFIQILSRWFGSIWETDWFFRRYFYFFFLYLCCLLQRGKTRKMAENNCNTFEMLLVDNGDDWRITWSLRRRQSFPPDLRKRKRREERDVERSDSWHLRAYLAHLRHQHLLVHWLFHFVHFLIVDHHVRRICVDRIHHLGHHPLTYPFGTWSSVTSLAELEKTIEVTMEGDVCDRGRSCLHLVSDGPLTANVFEPSDACTFGFVKWITSPSSLNMLTYGNDKKWLNGAKTFVRYLFNALNTIGTQFFQWALKFLVVGVGRTMDDFLLSACGTLRDKQMFSSTETLAIINKPCHQFWLHWHFRRVLLTSSGSVERLGSPRLMRRSSLSSDQRTSIDWVLIFSLKYNQIVKWLFIRGLI